MLAFVAVYYAVVTLFLHINSYCKTKLYSTQYAIKLLRHTIAMTGTISARLNINKYIVYKNNLKYFQLLYVLKWRLFIYNLLIINAARVYAYNV